MMKLPNFRLSTRIIAAALVIVAAGAMALMFIENAHLRDVYLNRQRATLEQELHAGKLRLVQAVNGLRQDVLFLSNTPPVSGMVRAALNRGQDPRYDGYTARMWEERLQQIFSAFSMGRPGYYQIRFIGIANGGRELVRIDRRNGKADVASPAELQAKADRDYFKAALRMRAGEVYLSEFNLNREWGVIEQPYRPTLRAVTPVFAPSGRIFGMVVINMDAAGLLESTVLDMPPGVLAYAANSGGQYLLHPDARKSFESELGGRDSIVADFPSLGALFDPSASEHFPLQIIPAMMRGPAGYLAAERVHFDPGNPARFLVLAHHLPAAAVSEQADRIPPGHIAGGFAVMLLTGGIALSVLRRTFAPLEQITAAADGIAAGGRDVPLPQNGSGEIVSLANALGAMLAALSQREEDIRRINTGLEERVRERTRDLEQSRRETEETLKLHKTVIDTAMDGFCMVDRMGNLQLANQAYADMSGYSVEELTRMNISQLEAREKPGDVRAHIEKTIAQGSDFFETRYRRKDGHEIDIEVSATFMRDTQQFAVFLHDITARKELEEMKLQESEERFRGTLEQAAVGIVHASLDGRLQQVNRKFCEITGYSRDELLGMNFRDITFPGDMDKNLDYLEQLLAGKIPTYSMEKRYIRKDRSLVWTNLTVSPLRSADGAPKYLIAVVEDITGRKQMKQRLRELSAHLQTVREEEKASIAREIHDNLGGTLTALKMDVYWLADELSAYGGAERLLEHAETMSRLLDDAVAVTRRVITDLRPTILDDLGLLAALEWQADQFQKRTGIRCHVADGCTGDCKDDLSGIQAINLFRIFQEALTNIARHSGASRVEAELRCEDGEVALTVSDNGCGLPEGHTIAPTSYGLLGMRERAEQLGGRLHFTAPSGGGFSVTVILPLHGGGRRHDTHPDR